ncbi:PREDICTED: lysophospholipid acyltransferase 1-like [Amphimedon queenslandica]|uniref:Uncharacterized protein n=1 Tax=Amphimedon queenslandica TaxID=400682 RepID=A0A1X7U496_AMPQE|nr:PREDICTED: lysophospholipid acyltransferase 1-like [Amphimedon queenslandica]|eukprot:XP_011406119.2 PREDICTED: lysophospholipid acyltransferase 1-like [Amphimedon queenslandica]
MDKLFEELSTILSVPVDKVRYVTLFLVSFPLATLLRVVLHYSYTSPTIRHTVSALLGLFFGWICFQWQVFYLIGFVLIGYILLVTLPPSIVQRYSMIYALISISTGHIYRLITDYGGYTLDFTGPLMLLVQRVSYVAYAYHDGVARDESKLTEDQKRHKIDSIPSLLEYFSYNFCFMTFLAGPTTTYREYDDFITGNNMIRAKQVTGSDPSPLVPVLKKASVSLLFLSIVVLNTQRLDKNLLLDPDLSFPRRLLNITIFASIIRCQYYFTFIIADGICNAGGLGYDSLASDESKRWSLTTMVDVYQIELATNARELISGWNLPTMNWLRRLIYDRGNKSVLLTNMVSAMWHGYYPGYYLSFFVAGLGTLVGRKLRFITQNAFDSSRVMKSSYTVLCIIVLSLMRDFNFISFQLMFLEDIFFIWKCYYFIPVIGLLSLFFLLPSVKKQKST